MSYITRQTKETTLAGVGTKQSKILVKKRFISRIKVTIMNTFGTFSLRHII
jgi:hypothetical protein